MTVDRGVTRASIVCLVAIFIIGGEHAQAEIFSDGFETGDSCEWTQTVTLDLCDGLDNDCDFDVDEDGICDDNLDCTVDQCITGNCHHTLDAGVACLIDDVCISHGAFNPLNPCQVCDSFLSMLDWTPVDDGTPCGDLVCNECISGVCMDSVIGVAGPGCNDSGTSACDSPDTCGPGGVCHPNYTAPGTLCGAGLVEPICDPDECDGSGSCIDIPTALNNTPCGGFVCEECEIGICQPFSLCGDGLVCPVTEACDDGNVDDCGTCSADCSAPGLGPSCPPGSGCVSGLDCLSGVCAGGICD